MDSSQSLHNLVCFNNMTIREKVKEWLQTKQSQL